MDDPLETDYNTLLIDQNLKFTLCIEILMIQRMNDIRLYLHHWQSVFIGHYIYVPTLIVFLYLHVLPKSFPSAKAEFSL